MWPCCQSRELNPSKAKIMPGHRCESAGVSHVASIMLGMRGQRAQGQECTSASTAKQSALGPAPHKASCCFPISPYSQQTRPTAQHLDCVPGTNALTPAPSCAESRVLATEVCWRAEVVWLCLLVRFHTPVLGSLNLETIQKMLVQKLCPAWIAKGKWFAQQMKSEYELLPILGVWFIL